MQSGFHVLSIAHTLGRQIRAENWPCSAMVAAWLQAVQGKKAETWKQWRAFDSALWDAVNVTDSNNPWSGVVAAFGALGYCATIADVSKTEIAPSLIDHTWHFVQRWKREPDNNRKPIVGHAYLAYREGDNVTICESGAIDGFQTHRGIWEGAAGLEKFLVGVVPLKNVPK